MLVYRGENNHRQRCATRGLKGARGFLGGIFEGDGWKVTWGLTFSFDRLLTSSELLTQHLKIS